MKRCIITTGYMGSGSSAATDLISEYKDCKNDFASFEYVLLHCPNGLFDLEDKLLRGNNAIRSDEAIRSFRKTMKELSDKKYWWVGHYNTIISPDFMKVTDEFIDEITQFRFKGYWYQNENADLKMILKLILQKPFRILFGKFFEFKKITKYDGYMNISYVKQEEFYAAARKYVDKVIKLIVKDSENVVLDQFLLPFNLHRFNHYFDEKSYAIVVERDPRDVFILNKYIWPSKKLTVPFPTDVKDFCSYYKRMRESEIVQDTDHILKIHFEDLIYDYDTTVKRVQDMLGFDDTDHVNKKKRLNPEISIKNTQLFHEEQYRNEMKIIEEELKDYLYSFPYEMNNGIQDTVEFE